MRAAGGGDGSGECARAFVAAMGGLRVPRHSQLTVEALQDDSEAAYPALVDCLLFLRGSEEVGLPRPSTRTRPAISLASAAQQQCAPPGMSSCFEQN